MFLKTKWNGAGTLAAAMIVVGSTFAVASATPVFFFDEAAFVAAATNAGIPLSIESFESGVADLGATVTFPAGSAVGAVNGININSVGSPNTTDGTNSLSWFPASADTLTFNLSTPTNAFGIDVIDGFEASPFQLTLVVSGGSNTYSPGNQASDNVQFIGVIDTMQTFGSAQISLATEFILFDRLQTGVANIPEPGTLALFGFGLAGLGYMRRRQPA